MDIEKIIMVGVIWNAVLQTIWFVIDLRRSQNKHV
jgi:hypothetical protein